MSNVGHLLTAAEAAIRLGVTPRQIARLVPDMLRPAAKGPGPRGAYLFAEEEVEAERLRRIAAVTRGLRALEESASPSPGVDAAVPVPDLPGAAAPSTEEGVAS